MKLMENWKRFWTLNRHHAAGFTLVELIVVIAILAILAGVAVPAYSGYIAQANKAADEQLLDALNTAFASACAINGQDHYKRTDVDIKMVDVEGGKEVEVTVSGIEDFGEAFARFYEGGVFKVFTTLTYNETTGMFEVASSAFSDLFNTLKEKYGEEIAQVLTTNLGQIGTENLFDQMNGAMDMASELELHNLTGAPFAEAYFRYLGFDPADYETDEERAIAWDAKLAALGVDDATAATHAIVLYTAENSTTLTTSNLSNWLGGDSTTDDLQDSANANTLAEAAAIYGLYLSYNKETTGTVPEGGTLMVMTEALSNEDFAAWVNTSPNAQTELEAYKTYMSIINEAAKDENTKNAILSNGFENPELEELMKELMGN